MTLPRDYVERVYGGVLGKIIGVYMGKPFEGWSYERIMRELGEVNYYVHDRLGRMLIAPDDDISGTFTFIRGLEDYGNSKDLSARQIGQTWLNYLIEGKTVLWWGGMGTSTEHTAYLRLKQGMEAPQSGSIASNGKVVAEQIGAQIFIDGWAMVAAGNPGLAAELARRASSVSHDGEAIYGAQVVAAIEAQAFVESDMDKLIDTGVSFISKDSVIYRMIADLRNWRERESDWRKARELLAANYGYDKYGGGCHMVPNHGLIILSLLYGEGDFQKSLMIVNTCGWDTDCNSGNVGCIMGIRNGLAGIDGGPDLRSPVADRLLIPTADGGNCMTDAVTQTYRIVNMGRALAGEKPLAPKNGARFHFELPGSVQGFVLEDSPECKGLARIGNGGRYPMPQGAESNGNLLISYEHLGPGRFVRVAVATFMTPDLAGIKAGYGVQASPTLYSGQHLEVVLNVIQVERVEVSDGVVPVTCRLYLRVYGGNDQLARIYGPETTIQPTLQAPSGALTDGLGFSVLAWDIPDTNGGAIAEVGIELSALRRTDGALHIQYLRWDGQPRLTFRSPGEGATLANRAWTTDCEQAAYRGGSDEFRMVKNEGRGLAIQGTREWKDYRVAATITPHMVKAMGLAARVQGLRRYYGLLLERHGVARLVKVLDGEKTLGTASFSWEFDRPCKLAMEVKGTRIVASIDDRVFFDVTDQDRSLDGGAMALVCEEGRLVAGSVRIEPVF